ncbi:tRNA (adenosine(37)-N6)-dimethylallyltransferase MiaA [Actinomycetospora lutea]|uniref:tRNA (adenosine(37)-N6)-dimethylallyltransferase MiaA n=1 Tax=Actinomycetospora lutea TaxID=663604 RepID=UPI0023654B32|nr:tRNA (adenosine(37)-N6)-dimethylallyltransferase MiaA [Actinomycetospora lutea]MDD7938874.1 tRNA (adenosine(37)-N6)-dimethylallyltransferase MiaA [Actinomycetospora lutea]
MTRPIGRAPLSACSPVPGLPRPIALVGPTATGKSDLALDLAEELARRGAGAEVVNADAMQLYRGMDVGTAKLPPAARRGVPHHLLDVLEVTDTATVAAYQRDARAAVDAIRARGRVPLVVGGSGLYVQAVLDDLAFPGTDPALRARLDAELAALGAPAMHARLADRDPDAARGILASNGRRIVRALEVVELTGRPFAASLPVPGTPRHDAVLVGLDRDTEVLDERIAARVDAMLAGGLVDEVAALAARGLREGATAARAVGYREVLEHLDGTIDLDEARRRTVVATRRLVRRQRSWFRRDGRVHWLDAAAPDLVATVLGLAVPSDGPLRSI